MHAFFASLGPALAGVTHPITLVFILAGVVVGIFFGVLPGFGAAQALAVLFPLTFSMSKEVAILFLLAVYHAAEYGGSIPAILIRTPGTPSSAVVILDGYAMTRKGLAKKALQISLVSGVIGGVVSTLIFLVSGASLAYIGLQFGPAEMFSLGVLGLAIIGGFFGDDATKGFMVTGLGLLLSTVGTSGFGGIRFAFNQPYLMEGFPVIVVVMGLLAGMEAISLLVDHRRTIEERLKIDQTDSAERNRLTREDIRQLIPTWIRHSLLGTLIGALPGGGGAVASVISYNEEKRWSKRGHLFGSGVAEGVAAPETASNAVVAGALVPSLALGIPGSAASAILIGVLISKGVAPGPIMFQTESVFIMEIFIGLLIANVFLLGVGLVGARAFSIVSYVPRRLLGPFVLILILIGAYSYQTYSAHVVMMLALGAVAYLFQKAGMSVVPAVLGFIMGPIIEQNLSRALTIDQGDFLAVIDRPISATILLLAAAAVTYSAVQRRRRRRAVAAVVS